MRLFRPVLGLAVATLSTLAFADELLTDGSFELPVVTARSPKEKGGDPYYAGKGTQWAVCDHKVGDKGGTVEAGLTNEIARRGNQSFYITFNKVTVSFEGAAVQTTLIPIRPEGVYNVSIWGRLDPANLLSLDGRIPYLKLVVDFYGKDGAESVGEPVFRTQPVPGTKNYPQLFTADAWHSFTVEAVAPPEAVFIQVTWKWETGSIGGKNGEAGSPGPGMETTGTVFFDDASIDGPEAPNPDLKPTIPEEMTAGAEESPAASPSPAPAEGPKHSPAPQPSPVKKH